MCRVCRVCVVSCVKQSEADKEELRDTVDRKLRVPALVTCTWYYRARASTVATSATADRATCLAALRQFLHNFKSK